MSHDREMVMRDVVVRVSPSFELDLQVDTDEANAAGLTSGFLGSWLPA